MYLEEIDNTRTLQKIKKITETLNTVFGLDIDFSTSIEDLTVTLNHFEDRKTNALREAAFNNYFVDPEYSKSYLICEAIRLFLSEVKPTRKLRKKIR